MIKTEDFTKWTGLLLADTFGVLAESESYILDTGQSGLLGTINAISAAVASTARKPEHATIASHCAHVLYILCLFDAYEQGQTPTPDWPGSWTTRVVDEAAWNTLRSELQAAYDSVATRLQARDTWPEAAVAAALMLLAHCAYHLGEVRQLLTSVSA